MAAAKEDEVTVRVAAAGTPFLLQTPVQDEPTLFELPPLIIDGIPKPVEKMTLGQLRRFIPGMLKCTTGPGNSGYAGESTRPPWWPKEIPWANIRKDTRSKREKRKCTWTHALREIIINCYQHHGREDLLASTAQLCLDPAGYSSSVDIQSTQGEGGTPVHTIQTISGESGAQGEVVDLNSVTGATLNSEGKIILTDEDGHEEPPAETPLLPRISLLAGFDPLFESDLSNSQASIGDLDNTQVVLDIANESSELSFTEIFHAILDTSAVEINTSVDDINDTMVVVDLSNESNEKLTISIGDLDNTRLELEVANESSEPSITEIIHAVEQINSVGGLNNTKVVNSSIEHVKENISTSLNDTASERPDLSEKTVESFEPHLPSAHILLKAMTDMSDKLALRENENADLKLQLKALKVREAELLSEMNARKNDEANYRSNQEMQLLREQYASEIHQLAAIIKRLEKKIASLAELLHKKTKECSAVAAEKCIGS